MGTLWHSCAKVREPMELLFGVVIGVGPSIGVLYGVYMPQWEGRLWGFFSPIGLNGFFECILKTDMYLTHAWKVDSISVWIIYQWNCYLLFFLKMYFATRLKFAFVRNLLKCNSDFTKLQHCLEVNITMAMIALPVAWFLHYLAVYNSVDLAS